MAHDFDRDEIARLMLEARNRTHELYGRVISETDLRRPPAEGFRPMLWHLGHIGAFEGYWILQQVKGDAPISEQYDAIFDPIKTPREDASNLPPIPDIEEYLGLTRAAALDFLASVPAGGADAMLRGGYAFHLVLEHEWQHQETLCYLLQMLAPELKRKPEWLGGGDTPTAAMDMRRLSAMVEVPGGEYERGSAGYPFAYDNEQPPHRVQVADFRIDRFPVTNREYAEFLEDGGYRRQELWDEEGWRWKEQVGIERPLYWIEVDGGGAGAEPASRWRLREMFEERMLPADHPVTGVSWYEAQAYARWARKRLPTEAEWEKAASWDPRAGRKRRFSWGDQMPQPEIVNFDNHYWRTTPVGRFAAGQSAYGCFDMTGNVWEWTASAFDAYPGFTVFPYPEYSQLWFDGDHRVLKGGSWTTRGALLRCSFRNFFRPRFRAAFAGFRCAADE